MSKRKTPTHFQQIKSQLDRIERKLGRSERNAEDRARTEMDMEFYNMITTEALAGELSKIRGVVPSIKAFLKAQDEKYAALAASMSDEEDQAKVNAMAEEARLAADELAAAIVANPAPGDPPAEPPVG